LKYQRKSQWISESVGQWVSKYYVWEILQIGIRRRRLFAHASQGRIPIIPFFQHSIIPIAERRGAKF